jgi:zinc transporter 1
MGLKKFHLHMPSMTPTQRLSTVIVISFSFFVAEIAIGFSTRSLALIADAFHYLTDLVGFIVAFSAIQISKGGKSPKDFSFGWQRAQLLGAFFNGVFLAALGLSIFLQAIERFVSIQKVKDPKLVLIVGCVGLGLNIISVVFLHDHDHGHDHGSGDSSHDYSPPAMPNRASAAEATRLSFNAAASAGVHASHRHTTNTPPHSHAHNLGLMGVLLHVIGDAINNIGVIVSALAIWFGKSQGRYYADPAVSMFISFMILGTSIPLIKSSGRILLQSGPTGVDMAHVKEDLQGLPGVSSVHELHIWRLNEQKTIASAHVVTDDETLDGFIERARQIGECLHAYGVHSYTLQPEPKSALPLPVSVSRKNTNTGPITDASAGAEVENVEEGGDGMQNASLRQREPFCQLKCEVETCKDLQCCDE